MGKSKSSNSKKKGRRKKEANRTEAETENTDHNVACTRVLSTFESKSNPEPQFGPRPQTPIRVSSTWKYWQLSENLYTADIEPEDIFKQVEKCNCLHSWKNTLPCGSLCIGRSTNTECSLRVCVNGKLCTNMVIQKRAYAPGLERCMTSKKGWGVHARQCVVKGGLILEYTGEVCSIKEYERRILTSYKGNNHNYFLSVDGNSMIDATRAGSECRYVNHSCAPNCVMEKWNVDGLPRLALFALRDILPGEEICYDYNFSLINPDQSKQCHCGAKECKGVMGGRGKGPISQDNEESHIVENVTRKMAEGGVSVPLYEWGHHVCEADGPVQEQAAAGGGPGPEEEPDQGGGPLLQAPQSHSLLCGTQAEQLWRDNHQAHHQPPQPSNLTKPLHPQAPGKEHSLPSGLLQPPSRNQHPQATNKSQPCQDVPSSEHHQRRPAPHHLPAVEACRPLLHVPKPGLTVKPSSQLLKPAVVQALFKAQMKKTLTKKNPQAAAGPSRPITEQNNVGMYELQEGGLENGVMSSHKEIYGAIFKNVKQELEAKHSKLNLLIKEKKDMEIEIDLELDNLVEKKQNTVDKISAISDEWKNLNVLLEKYQDQQMCKIKEINELQKKKDDLLEGYNSDERSIRECVSKKLKLETLIEQESEKAKGEEKVINSRIEDLNRKLCKTVSAIDNLPNEVLTFSPIQPVQTTSKLLEFIEREISDKEDKLECPICLEVAGLPIYMCQEMHLICPKCRPKVKECPECREVYEIKYKRHRYAEMMAEELARLKTQRNEILGSLC